MLNTVKDHVKNNQHIYGDKRNLVTLILWGLALASHAILLPRLIKELYDDFKQPRQ